MATRAEQARLFNEAIAQGLTEDQALAYAGIKDPNEFSYAFDSNQLEPINLAPPRRPEETIVPAGQSIDYGDDDDDVFPPASLIQTSQTQNTGIAPPSEPRVVPVSSSIETTGQETVTGGTVTTTRVTPTTYRDTDTSLAFSNEANALQSQKEARAAELRSQGLTGAQVLRDPEYRNLSQAQQSAENAAQDARTVDQAGDVFVTTSPGSGIVNETTINSDYVVNDTSGVDPYANLAEIEQEPGGFFGEPQREVPVDDFEFEQYQAELAAEREAAEASTLREPNDVDLADDPQADLGTQGTAFDDDGNLNPGWTLDGNGEAVFVGSDFIDPNLQSSADASRAAAQQQAFKDQARAQAILQQQRKQANDGDWRVRLRLAPLANYLYKAETPGPLLQPLKDTDGVVFPYTPQITTAYRADYSDYKLTHSNYRGFFYQSSYMEDIQITATFTAQDTFEANYLLAVITFFKSLTKMFYGQDAQRGAPPPMVFLQGLGQYQFNLNPCVVSQFNYVLPNDVDYIRAQSPGNNATNLLNRRSRQSLPTNPFSSAAARIESILKPQGINVGAQPAAPAPPTLGKNSPTYVPTKIDITLVLHPMQSREQISKQFSLRQFANGDLIKGGFW